MYTWLMREHRENAGAGRGWAGGAIALGLGFAVVLGVVGWLWWNMRAVDGSTKLRGLPLFPGATAVVVRDESSRGEQIAVLSFEARAKVEDVYGYYDDALMDRDWQSVGRPSDGGGSGYTKRDGSFEGVELTDERFPWVQIVTNRSPMWLNIDVAEAEGAGAGKVEVAIRWMEP